jgi:hypothetical protein
MRKNIGHILTDMVNIATSLRRESTNNPNRRRTQMSKSIGIVVLAGLLAMGINLHAAEMPKIDPNGAYVIKLERPFERGDVPAWLPLRISVALKAGALATGHAFITEFNNTWHPVDVSKLRLADGAFSGEIAVTFRDFGQGAESERAVIAPLLLACIGNPQRKPYRQPGDYEFRFSLTTHAAGYVPGSRFGIQSQNPLWAVIPSPRAAAAPAKLPVSASFFALQPANAAFTAIKKAEDDNSIVFRIYDLDGAPAEARVSSRFRVQAAQLTDLLERDGQPLPAQGDAVTVPLKAWGIETVKVRLGKAE